MRRRHKLRWLAWGALGALFCEWAWRWSAKEPTGVPILNSRASYAWPADSSWTGES
jgi:hypothetical protein